jgi:hypothetical protein
MEGERERERERVARWRNKQRVWRRKKGQQTSLMGSAEETGG